MQTVKTITDLGFVTVEDGQPRSMWAPKASGVYALDNKIGRTHADQCVGFMRAQNDPSLLGRVVGEMVRGGRYGGVEVGFMHRVADHTVREIVPV